MARDGSRYNQLYHDRRAAWPLRRVTIQSLDRDRRKAWLLGVSRYNAATWLGLCYNMAEEPATWRARHNTRYGRACAATWLGVHYDTPTIQSREGHDMARGRLRHGAGAPRHGRPSAQRAGSLSQSVHLVHPTQF